MDVGDIDGGVLRRNFNWPADEGQIWRHLSDYTIMDEDGKLVEACRVEHGHYKARGTLLARPGSNIQCIANVEITFEGYSIDFGKTSDDAARGYWVESEERKHSPHSDGPDTDAWNGSDANKDKGKKKKKRKVETETVWYKFEIPHRDYKQFAAQMEQQVKKYLEFHDALTKTGSNFVTVNLINQRIICRMVRLTALRPLLAIAHFTTPLFTLLTRPITLTQTSTTSQSTTITRPIQNAPRIFRIFCHNSHITLTILTTNRFNTRRKSKTFMRKQTLPST